MTVGTAGKETYGYEGRNHPTRRCRFPYLHYAVRMKVGTACKETCGYEHYAVRMTAN